MPVYSYECDECGTRFEQYRHYGAPHPKTCPEGHKSVHRVFSPPTIIFKGSGFYATDNAHGNGRTSDRKTQDHEPSKAVEKETKAKVKEQEKE